MIPFDREQLKLVVRVILAGAEDRIISCLPQYNHESDWTFYNKNAKDIDQYIQGCANTVYMTLPCLYAHILDDGMSPLEHEGANILEHFLESMKERWLDVVKLPCEQFGPASNAFYRENDKLTEEIINEFVDKEFANYLAQ
jgi:hypothetical protein